MASRTVADCMTPRPSIADVSDTLLSAARTMASQDVGALVVQSDMRLVGIVTDRDIVVRGIAEGLGPDSTLSDVMSDRLVAVGPGDSVEVAVQVMRDAAVRRAPVVDGSVVVGVVSLGDLAVERDPESVLADISEASPDR
ncbi:CBS domain-containing protein [Isoptericola croceus]|uniref:CBS domain-containing protein n=1 Tax=Isoptericola croceus TaxID=3031406 RepID=UPI0023F993BC|nr:CBS domain-containing protein [Isoptericola croceus]